MPVKVFYCSSFGRCRLLLHSELRIINFLKSNGFILVKNPRQADKIVINTCGFLQSKEKEAIAMIKHFASKYAFRKKIIVCGCLAKINPSLNLPKNLLEKITLIGPKELQRFNDIFSPDRMSIADVKVNLADGNDKEKNLNILIGRGCVNRCAYCAIKKAIGAPTSRPPAEIIAEFKNGLKSGFKNFNLLADDCGSYGLDIGTDFAELLNAPCRFEDNYKISVHYIEPRRLKILFPKINKSCFNKISSIRMPMQSLNRRIIALMNRNYRPEEIFALVKKIKTLAPSLKLRTQIIFNFPTETEKEFGVNINHPILNFFDEVVFSSYSARKGTPAAGLKDLSFKVKNKRIEEIKRLSLEKTNCSLVL